MQRIMLRMVSLEGGEMASRRVTVDELRYSSDAENQRIKQVVDLLVNARLVAQGTDQNARPYIEPAHDALVRAWATLWQWVMRVGEDKILLRSKVNAAAKDWEESQFSAKYLWNNDPRLGLLQAELNRPERWFNDAEHQFVKGSVIRKRTRTRWLRAIVTSVIVVLTGLVIWALWNLFNVHALKYYDNTFSAAKKFEEKAGKALLDQDVRELEKSWLYTLAALGQDLDKEKNKNGLPVSKQRFIRQGISAGVYQQIWASPGALNEINNVEFSPDGKRVAIASVDGTIRFCDMETGAELNALIAHENGVSDVAFSHDGKWLASASKDRTVKLWDLEKDTLIVELIGHRSDVRSVAFSPDDKILASSSKDKTIILWEIEIIPA